MDGPPKSKDVRKRKRVIFNEIDNTERAAGASSGAKAPPATDGVDFFDDDDEGGETEIAEQKLGDGYDLDDDNEAGDEQADAAGASEVGRVAPRGAKAAGGAGADGEEGGEEKRVKVLRRVKGELGGQAHFDEEGQAFEPFNLRSERNEGFFDESGNYTWKKKTAEDYDPWLDELDAMDPKERKRLQEIAARKAGAGGRGDGEDDDEDEGSSKGGDDVPPEPEAEDLPATARVAHLSVLYTSVREGETVAGALRRLGATSRASTKAAGKGAPKTQEALDFDALTEAADALLTNGMVDIYSTQRRALLLELNDARDDAGLPPVREVAAASASVPSAPPVVLAAPPAVAFDTTVRRWEYRWGAPEGNSGANGSGGTSDSAGAAAPAAYGPYTSAEMAAWRAAGYFAGRPVFVRDLQAAAASAPAQAAGLGAGTSGAAMDEDDDDGDIFGGVGKYTAPPGTAGPAGWVPVDSVQF